MPQELQKTIKASVMENTKTNRVGDLGIKLVSPEKVKGTDINNLFAESTPQDEFQNFASN